MIPENRKISSLQLLFFVIQAQVGAGILSLPHKMELAAKADAWIPLLLSGLIVQILVILYWVFLRRHPQHHLFQLAPALLGKFAGTLTSVVYIAYFLFLSTLTQISYYQIISKWAYPSTPKWIILALMTVVTAYMCKQSFQVFARVNSILCFTFIPVIGLIIFTISHGHLNYLLPVGQSSLPDIFSGIKTSIVSLTGFEIILVVYPYVQGSARTILVKVMYATTFVTLLYTLTTIAAMAFFSPKLLSVIPEPVLYMIKTFSLGVFERLEYLFLAFWIMKVVTSVAIIMFASSVGMAHLFGARSHSQFALISSLIPYGFALWTEDPFITDKMSSILELWSPLVYIVLPVLLLTASYVQGRKGRQKAI